MNFFIVISSLKAGTIREIDGKESVGLTLPFKLYAKDKIIQVPNRKIAITKIA